jgi:hypothetical protein
MKTDIQKTIDELSTLRLPELWKRYKDILGEETKAPNKRFLVTRITEALEARATEDLESAEAAAPPRDTGELKLSKLSVEELRALHLELTGRESRSDNLAYLRWRVGQARKGKVPSGSRSPHRSDGPAPDFKVLPLRMEAPLVEAIDAARERLGLKSRMDLFRIALHAYFEANGETDVAAQITWAD